MSVTDKQHWDAPQKVSSETIKQTLKRAALRARFLRIVADMETASIPAHEFDAEARDLYLQELSNLERKLSTR
jgi:hypothetical protein